MGTVYRSSIIPAPVSVVWQSIRDYAQLHTWFPGVSDTRLEGSGRGDHPGCVRNFGLPDGSRMREELLEFSDQHHFCAYRMLEGKVPMSRYQARVHLLPVTDGDQTFIEMTADFDCPPGQEDGVSAFLGGMYQGAMDGLKNKLRKS